MKGRFNSQINSPKDPFPTHMNKDSLGHPAFHQMIQITLQLFILWQAVFSVKGELQFGQRLPASLPWEEIVFQVQR